MLITDKELAHYYGITARTVSNYKKGTTEKQRLYISLLNGYKMPSKNRMDMNTEELYAAKSFYLNRIQSDADEIQVLDDCIYNINQSNLS